MEIPPKLDSSPEPSAASRVEAGIVPEAVAGVPPVLPVFPMLSGHLHPLTLVVALFTTIRNLLIPAVFMLITRTEATLGLVLLFFVGLSLISSLVRYLTFTYRIQGGELITRQGVLERRERNIPLTRVQDLRIEQGLVHRLLGVVDLHVETAGGQGAEASLSVLRRRDADVLRRAVFEQAAEVARVGGMERESKAVESRTLRRLGAGELVLAGLTSNQVASVLVLILAGWQFLDRMLPPETYQRLVSRLALGIERWVEQGAHADWVLVLAGAGILLAVGLSISVMGSLVLFHQFTLSLRGEDLHRNYGLLTRRSSSLPRRRIQLLQIQESWMRRWFGLATLRVDTAGSRMPDQTQGREGRDVLLPVVPRVEVDALLPVLFPDLDDAVPAWHDVSRCAIRRGTTKGAVVCGLLALLSAATQDWQLAAFWPLLLVLPIYGINVLQYKHLGYSISERFFRTRRGWLSRATHVVPIRNSQILTVRETPFDRRFGVATLSVDTAGQAYTGGGPRLRNIPVEEALAAARAVAVRAARTRYRC
jgi:putative membrane protein